MNERKNTSDTVADLESHFRREADTSKLAGDAGRRESFKGAFRERDSAP